MNHRHRNKTEINKHNRKRKMPLGLGPWGAILVQIIQKTVVGLKQKVLFTQRDFQDARLAMSAILAPTISHDCKLTEKEERSEKRKRERECGNQAGIVPRLIA